MSIEDASIQGNISKHLIRALIREGMVESFFAGTMVHYRDVLRAAYEYENRLLAARGHALRPRGQGGRPRLNR